MSNQELTYEDYNKRSIAVRGDREKFSNALKEVDGRWNPRMKNGPGWLVPKEKETELKKIIDKVIDNKDVLENELLVLQAIIDQQE